MSDDHAQAFADALQHLEKSGDVDAFVQEQFADGATLLRPEVDQEVSGSDGARQYWQQYLGQFSDIASSFDRITGSGNLGVLEWTSTGTLAAGASINYRGVSLLDFDDQGKVSRFATYFDTAPFAGAATS
ncbi:nuclear transport factor 2 family protein [Nakamurella flava]|uniref:Nuclear transport factor 2 family protein n=1 Tax=Nakamurella flava TaxID=2576308 RepID=A0A4U6QFN2_9ACTN|nr:nuclear transport factor 2 family protein [Nakamurella flava]TKV58852.1 nuclear transport factor 2 family protein [Nakamurella flava]